MALEFRIAAGSATPIYRQIVDQVRRGVAVGALAPGDQLPSVRALAEQLVVNPNTVAKAYSELSGDGLVESRPGRGNFVADRRQVFSKAECARRFDQAAEAFLGAVLVLNYTPQEIQQVLAKKLVNMTTARGSRRGRSNG